MALGERLQRQRRAFEQASALRLGLRDLVLKPLLATGALLQLARLVLLLRSSRVDMLA